MLFKRGKWRQTTMNKHKDSLIYGFLTMTWRTAFTVGRAFWDPKSDWRCSIKQTIQVPNCSKHEKENRKEPHANDNDEDNDDVGQNTHLHPNLPGLKNTTSNHSSPAEVPVWLPTVSRGCMRSRPYQSWRCQGEDLENTIRCQAPGDGIMKLGPGLEVVDFLFFYTVKTVLLASWNTCLYIILFTKKNIREVWSLYLDIT